jgi:hypothetical protein
MMPAGRPTKYTRELLDKCYTYIAEWRTLGDMIPSQIALQEYIDISNACLNDWKNDPEKEEFSRILDKINRLQQHELINKGLSGDFNSNITKLVLGKHGFHDKQETTNKTEITLSDDELDMRIKALMNEM